MRQITKAAQRGRRLSEEIQAFFGSDIEEPRHCETHSIIRNALSLFKTQPVSALRIKTDLTAKDDVIFAPPSSIRHVIFSLLTNAIDSLSEGSILTIKTTNVKMGSDGEPQRFLRIEIADRDDGTPGERPSRHESEVSNEQDVKLSNLYRMVSRLDGTVTISRPSEERTQVEVLLPLASEDEQRATHHITPSSIWVVDDDPISRKMCKQVLAGEGDRVHELSSGAAMKELWESPHALPDLLIIDFSMPDYNGLELCEWLNEQKSSAPIILVSGFARNQPDIDKALTLRNVFFLQKPFSVPALSDMVTVALGETLIEG